MSKVFKFGGSTNICFFYRPSTFLFLTTELQSYKFWLRIISRLATSYIYNKLMLNHLLKYHCFFFRGHYAEIVTSIAILCALVFGYNENLYVILALLHAYKFKTAVDSHATSCEGQNLFEGNVCLSVCAFNGEGGGGGGKPGGKNIKMLHEMSGFRGSSLLQHVYPSRPWCMPHSVYSRSLGWFSLNGLVQVDGCRWLFFLKRKTVNSPLLFAVLSALLLWLSQHT